jgi:hypothetical protein
MLLADHVHMLRRRRNEDPAYIQAMKEAKELFDAEMAKAAMKRKGRPPKVVAKVAVAEDDDLDHAVDDEEVEPEIEVVIPPPPPSPAAKKAVAKPAAKAAKPAKAAAKPAKVAKAAKPAKNAKKR